MSLAEIYNKLGDGNSFPTNSEDLLTSDVFQALKYLKPELILLPYLNSIFKDNCINIRFRISDNWVSEFYLWPKGQKLFREPDVLLLLRNDNDEYAFVIECKYNSGPSNIYKIINGNQYGNQLSDQYHDLIYGKYIFQNTELKLSSKLENRFLLYLTNDYLKPKEIICESINEYNNNSTSKNNFIEKNIVWANWSKLWAVLIKIDTSDFPYSEIISDLKKLLDRKGFVTFCGFSNLNINMSFNLNYIAFFRSNWFNFTKINISKIYKNFYNTNI